MDCSTLNESPRMAGLSLTLDPLGSMAVATAAFLPRYSALSSRLQSNSAFLPATRPAITDILANMPARLGYQPELDTGVIGAAL